MRRLQSGLLLCFVLAATVPLMGVDCDYGTPCAAGSEGTPGPGGGECGECASDYDCGLYSNNCDGCACEGLPFGSPAPTCSGTAVMCTVDPCINYYPTCNAGFCEAVALP